MILLTIIILYCASGADRCYVERGCIGGGRYEAMAQGHDCFNPPRDPIPKKHRKVWL